MLSKSCWHQSMQHLIGPGSMPCASSSVMPGESLPCVQYVNAASLTPQKSPKQRGSWGKITIG